jgi:hypothetical protein
MLYMMLIHNDPDVPLNVDDAIAQHKAVVGRARAKGAYIYGESLGPANLSATVRKSGGQPGTITDGPFAETKEFLAGFHIIDCADLEEAIAYARDLPEGAVEVVPLRAVPGWDYPVAAERERAPFE